MDWLIGIGALAASALLGYYIGVQFTKKKCRVNNKIRLSSDKVVDSVDMEDLGAKKVFCRCWKSDQVDDFWNFIHLKTDPSTLL
ncbi:unnamed protein product [Gongylonema pulchrum]|uniref:MitoNEET_N domain-containing protein n=1 Tax=Gongylonema pulchrum TaxID=637853 RepID=A0A183E824_9BILA|nr:unnamed protein product [Gongylonema pulchrum]